MIHAAVVLFSASSCYVPLLYVLPCLMPGKILQDRPGPSKTLAALWKCWQRSKSSPLTSHLSKTKLEVQISSGMQDLNLCLWHFLCLEGAKGSHFPKFLPVFSPENRSKSRRSDFLEAAVSLTATARSSHFAEDCEGTHEPSGETASVSQLKLQVGWGAFLVPESQPFFGHGWLSIG